MDNSYVKIHDRNGVEIGSIICPQTWLDSITPESFGRNSFGFMTTTYKKNVWKDPEAIILWAWKQSINSLMFYKQDLINKNPVPCIICGRKSIIVKILPLFKNKWRGIYCSNPHCSMHNVLIPAKIFISLPPKNVLDALNIDIV
jgi:hypothetical protein